MESGLEDRTVQQHYPQAQLPQQVPNESFMAQMMVNVSYHMYMSSIRTHHWFLDEENAIGDSTIEPTTERKKRSECQ